MSAPIFVDPILDGAADPTVIRNAQTGEWVMFYTNRRANFGGDHVGWIHGCAIGKATSKDGSSWQYRGTVAGLDRPTDAPGLNTHWAPEVIFAEGTYHMYLSYVPGAPTTYVGVPRNIRHYTSPDLENWTFQSQLPLSSDYVIDAAVSLCPDGFYRLWYKDEGHGSGTYVARSRDLFAWKPDGVAIPGKPDGLPHEGPNVFHLGGRYWMIVDEWRGQGVFSSPDAKTWSRQGRILGEPGRDPADRRYGRHADVVVAGENEAVLFYFTHPEWDEQNIPAQRTTAERRTTIHCARLWVEGGELRADRDVGPLPLR